MKHVHLIGIGGAGMSGLAEILLLRGMIVSGSDTASNKKTEELASLGAKIFIGHDVQNVEGADVLLYSSAVSEENIERQEAARRGIRQVRRADFLREIVAGHVVVAVAGTHGKTTTTSMIALVLIEAGLDPLVLVGASVKELGGKNSRAGAGRIAVVEADEFDRSFLALGGSYISVLTSLEAEHLDTYGTFDALKDAFVQFANQSDSASVIAGNGFPGQHRQGYTVVSIDDPTLREITPRLEKKMVTYGIDAPETKYRAKDMVQNGHRTHATLIRSGDRAGEIELRVPGRHNVQNALAAIAVADILSIPLEITLRALRRFTGADRRFERIGEAGGITVIDDYAHHPTEVKATLTAARAVYPGRRLIACFQPHTFTRTRDFADGFGEAFATNADLFVLLDIYPAREEPIEGVTSDLIETAAQKNGMTSVYRVSQPQELSQLLEQILEPGDVVLTMGAGTITAAAPVIVHDLETNLPQTVDEL
ncbi:MAG TPA: UDP-N-acetylmuramate--L-alanine ligase [Candidatus Kapabacteria bacterium]